MLEAVDRHFPGQESQSPIISAMTFARFCSYRNQGPLWSRPQLQGKTITFHSKSRGAHRSFFCTQTFDGYFVLQWLRKNAIVPKVILNGSRILHSNVPDLKIKFQDSINFIPPSLAKWPSALGMSDVAKSHFTRKFNQKKHWDWVVDFPDMELYKF